MAVRIEITIKFTGSDANQGYSFFLKSVFMNMSLFVGLKILMENIVIHIAIHFKRSILIFVAIQKITLAVQY